MRIGVLTGGGDCPGLNAAIRAVVKHGELAYGHSVVGFRNGWKGVAEGDFKTLTRADVRSVLPTGGTLLGTARFHPHREENGMEQVLRTLRAEHIDGLICIGGDGTLDAASKVAEAGVNLVGIPNTIDNDVEGTDISIGFHTAVNIATEAIDRVHTTAESHNRVMVVEVMGRDAGWIATYSGMAGGAEVILTPEEPFDIAEITKYLIHRHRSHASFSIVVVAEGALPKEDSAMDYEAPVGPYGTIVAGAISEAVAHEIQKRTGFDTRVTVLGHVQRGGVPTPTDRILGSRFGVAAVDALSEGKSSVMTALRGDRVELIRLEEIAGKLRKVPQELLYVAGSLS